MSTPVETWLPIPNWSAYEASDQGQVRRDARILSPWPSSSDGRPAVDLHMTPRRRAAGVHILVLETFVGPCPPGKEGCHWNGDPWDNALTNLRWDTRSANRYDSVRHGTHAMTARERCPRKHLLAMPNLTAWSIANNCRNCLACSRARAAVADARKRSRVLDVDVVAEQKYAEIMKGELAR